MLLKYAYLNIYIFTREKLRYWTRDHRPLIREDAPKMTANSDSLGCGHDRHECPRPKSTKGLTAVAECEEPGIKSRSDSLGCGHDRHGCSQPREVKELTGVAQ